MQGIGVTDLLEIHALMLDRYGDPRWWPGETPFEIAVGAILTQNTSWSNVEVAIRCLRERSLLDPFAIVEVRTEDLAAAIRSSGYHNQKASYLKAFCSFLVSRFGGNVRSMRGPDLSSLRQTLLSIRGIGEETADSILCYALDLPILVIDKYTKRMLSRFFPYLNDILGEVPSYGGVQELLMEGLKGDQALYNRFHALVVLTSKDHCRSRPVCEHCPLAARCGTGKKEYNRTTIGKLSVAGGGVEGCQ
jgi:endonuclease III related protein